MAQKIHLEFSENEKQVRIVFANGAKSAWYFSKNKISAALKAVFYSPPKGERLGITEFARMQKLILKSKDLPDFPPNLHTTVSTVSVGFSGFGGYSGFPDLESMQNGTLENFFPFGIARFSPFVGLFPLFEMEIHTSSLPDIKVKEAVLSRCPSGAGCWRFNTKTGWSEKFYSKEIGLVVITHLRNEFLIDQDEKENLLSELEESEAPKKEKEVLIHD